MSQQFFLHLGLHKTATTATQNYLLKISDHLLANDVLYIPLHKIRTEISPLICSMRSKQLHILFELLESFSNKKIILSDENILGGTGVLKDGNLYCNAKNRVVSFCKEAGRRPVTLFLTLREPGPYITSMYCEYLRHGDFITFADYIRNFNLENFSYARIFAWLKKLPRNTRVIVIPFEAPPEQNLLATAARILKETIGLNAMSVLPPFPESKSRSSFSLEEIDLATTIAKQAGGKMPREFLARLDALNCRFGHTKFAPLDSGLVERLRERYQQELDDFFSPMI
jgi:hypothetical protein